ncbi:MAG: O-antigen ligase family protein [Candidatus Zixiibacteriota bacterium]
MAVPKDSFSQLPDRQMQAAPRQAWLYFLIVVFSVTGGVGLLLANQIIVLAVLIAIIGGAMIFMYPFLGLVIFVILSFIRPADFMPALAAIPLAKVIGGATLIALIFARIRTRDFELGGRQAMLLFAFAATLFISIPLSFWPQHSLEISLDFLKIILFYFLFVNIVRDLKKLKIISLIAMASIIVLCLSTIQSFLTGNARAASVIGEGLFGDANDIALVLVTAIPLTGYLMIGRGWKQHYRVIQIGLILLLIVGTIVTKSRGGFLGLAVVLFMMIMKLRSKTLGIIMFLGVIIIALAFLPSEFSDRYSTIGTYEQDSSAMGRLYAWQAGINMMIARPITGVGVGCFETAFGNAFRPAGYGSAKWMAPHNTLIQVGGETGLIGLAIFMYLYLYSLFQLRKLKPGENNKHKESIGKIKSIIMISLIGFGVAAFFLTQAFNYILYFLIASVASLVKINENIERMTDNNKIENNLGKT